MVVGFPLKISYYYAFIVKQTKKTHFLNGISFKNFKFYLFFLNVINVYQYHTPKQIHPTIPSTS
jgi:hypothetical protein